MKLDRLMSGTFAAAAVVTLALVCGCSSSPAPRTTANANAAAANVSGTTNLMSAEMPGPAPRVGKAHLVAGSLEDSDIEVGATGNAASDENARGEKDARRSDGSRRGGGFGSTK